MADSLKRALVPPHMLALKGGSKKRERRWLFGACAIAQTVLVRRLAAGFRWHGVCSPIHLRTTRPTTMLDRVRVKLGYMVVIGKHLTFLW